MLSRRVLRLRGRFRSFHTSPASWNAPINHLTVGREGNDVLIPIALPGGGQYATLKLPSSASVDELRKKGAELLQKSGAAAEIAVRLDDDHAAAPGSLSLHDLLQYPWSMHVGGSKSLFSSLELAPGAL